MWPDCKSDRADDRFRRWSTQRSRSVGLATRSAQSDLQSDGPEYKHLQCVNK